MAPGLGSYWIYLWIFLLSNTCADPASRYIINNGQASFDQAMKDCSPGSLTTLTTRQEVTNVLTLISASLSSQSKFTFWVGLKKPKKNCVVTTLPLRGFRWMEDGSEDSEWVYWTQEPQSTCTITICAALTGEFNGSLVTSWGLTPANCKGPYQFICKLKDGLTVKKHEDTETINTSVAPESEPLTRPATQKPEPKAESQFPMQKPESTTDLTPITGSELAGPAPGSDLCQQPLINGSRSLSLDPEDSRRIQVECWSGIQLDLNCWGRPAMWYLLDSPVNLTTICHPCKNVYKDTSGNCLDVDKCGEQVGSAPCRHTCVNTEGSYLCICFDEYGKYQVEGSLTCTDLKTSGSVSGILVPVLVAVVALVVLVVVIAVTVKCCLMRRSRKRAYKKAEKMAMKNKVSKDSFATASEKT